MTRAVASFITTQDSKMKVKPQKYDKTFLKEKSADNDMLVLGEVESKTVCYEVGVTPLAGPTICLQ